MASVPMHKLSFADPDERKIIDSYTRRMTNWQNTQWMGAGSPTTKEELELFVNMERKA